MSSIDSLVLRFGDVLEASDGERVMFLTYRGSTIGWSGMRLAYPDHELSGPPGTVIRDYLRSGPEWTLIEVNDDEP